MSTKKIFCLLNCFNNYEIISGKIIEFYIQNAIKHMSSSSVITQTFFETTPFVLYASYISPIALYPGDNRSKQYQQFIIILGLVSVVLSRINSSDIVVFANQGVITLPGFSVMYNTANQLNKTTVLWNDDLRNLWGVTDDPLVIGMSPLPYKYFWSASTNPIQNPINNPYPKTLNGTSVTPIMGKIEDLCPKIDSTHVQKNWNTFIQMIEDSENVVSHNTSSIPSSRISNLISLGDKLINYIENTKKTSLGRGWSTLNTTLYWDIDFIIQNNLNLLTPSEQYFIHSNPFNKTPNISKTPDISKIPLYFDNSKQTSNISALNKGMERMILGKYTT
jgi:hypothetical protein